MPGLLHANKSLELKRFLRKLKVYSGSRVETIFTKIPNCCHYPPPYCTPQDGTRAARREGGRGWGDKFGKVLLKILHLNYDILGTGRKKESHLLIGKSM